MDDPLFQQYFDNPSNPIQRRYEALRAVAMGQSIVTVAHRFHYNYGALRNLVSHFRQQLQQGHPPPFSALLRLNQ